MKVIRGRKALVTGAGSGIGRAIAIALAREGADLCLLGRDESDLQAAAAEARSHGVETMVVLCDLTQPATITVTLKSVLQRWPRLDILINNAGVLYFGPTELMTAEQTDRILATNLLAPIQIVRELLPTFLAQRDAHIVNVASVLGLIALRHCTIYQTTKFGLVGFSKSLRVEYARSGIGVTALCPPLVRTPMLDGIMIGPSKRKRPIPAWACESPERVAEATIRAIRRNQSLVTLSVSARILWWLTRFSPRLFDWLMREGWRK